MPLCALNTWPTSSFDVGSTSHSFALGPRNATIRFLSPVSEDPWGVNGSPVFGDHGDVFALLFNGTVVCLDAFSGVTRWTFHMISGGNSAPSLSHGAVLVGDLMGYLYRLDARTGALTWRSDPYERIVADPVESGGAVFVAHNDASVRAFNFSTGALLWETSSASLNLTGAIFGFRPSLAMADGTPCPEDAGCDTLYLSPQDVHVPTRDSAVLALHAASGALRFRYAWPTPSGTSKVVPSPVVVLSGRAFWTAGSALFCVNASSGALLYYTTPTGSYYDSSGALPLLLSRTADLLIVPIMSAGTYGLRASTGEVLWLNGGSVSTAAGALDGGGTLFVMDVKNTLHALNASSGEQLMLDSGAAFEVATGWSGYSTALGIGPNLSLAVMGLTRGGITMMLMVGVPLAPLPPGVGGGGRAQSADIATVLGAALSTCSAVALLALVAARSGWGGAIKAAFGDGKAANRVQALRGVEIGINTEDFHSSLLSSEDKSAGRGFALLTAGSNGSSGVPLMASEADGGGGGAGAPRRLAWLEDLQGGYCESSSLQGGYSESSSRQPTLLNDAGVEGRGEPIYLTPFEMELKKRDGDSFVVGFGGK